VRFAAPVFPGGTVNLVARLDDSGLAFEARSDAATVLSNGYARF